ncbi:MAG: serine/threonine-protein kinase [Acidobacteriota bacterium]
MACLDHPPDEREAFAEAQCADDPVVLDEVRRLIRLRNEITERSSTWIEMNDPLSGDRDGGPTKQLGPEPTLGQVLLERYELIARIGAGAFGTVFRARDRVAETDVAVKTVALTDARAEAWHRREVAALLRSQLPGVVELLAVDEVDGWAIVVMALVDGAHFPGDGIEPDDTREILTRSARLLEAVTHLLAAGILHRDLKPPNILVSTNGEVTLVDLGIAEDENDALPPEDAGTLWYMAPEVLRGRAATAQSELYTAGLIILLALTDELPEPWSRAETDDILSLYSERARAILESALEPRVHQLLVATMAVDPRDRPSDPHALLAALRESLGSIHRVEPAPVGDGSAIDAVVNAVRRGESIDVVGAAGVGRTWTLQQAEQVLSEAGYLVEWVTPSSTQDETGSTWSRDHLERRLREGVVLFVDDHDALDTALREVITDLHGRGSIVRVLSRAEEVAPHVRLTCWTTEELQTLVHGPERLFHLPSQIAELLHQRTGGNPREVVRDLRAWCASGLAEWDGALRVDPRSLNRLRTSQRQPATPAEIRDLSLTPSARETWNALTFVGAPVFVTTLAAVMGRPASVIESDVSELAGCQLLAEADDGRLRPSVLSPYLSRVPEETLQRWSRHTSEHLPASSEARFRNLIAAGSYEEACRTAREVARSCLESARVPPAIAIADQALALARREVPGNDELHAELLSLLAEGALTRAQSVDIRLALYHTKMTPSRDVRSEAWERLLGAADAHFQGSHRQAIILIDAIDGLPTELHHRMARAVATHAARMARSPALHRAAVAKTAAWARRTRGREARALLDSSLGWLRFEEFGKSGYAAAFRLHRRASELSRRKRTKLSAKCNAAMAALELGRLEEVESLAQSALESARSLGERTTEARAELLVRQVRYRTMRSNSVDEELLQATELLQVDGTRGMIRLNEAAVAWRIRRLKLAGNLAHEATSDLRRSGFRGAAATASGLAATCGTPQPSLSDELDELTTSSEPIGLIAQALALASKNALSVRLDNGLLKRIRAWAEELPDLRREVLSPRETLSLLGVQPRQP